MFDPAKDLLNQAKHGASLALAEILFAAPHTVESDDRFDYGETRQVAMGRVGGRVFVCVFVDRGDSRRVISLRRANRREVQRFDQAIQ